MDGILLRALGEQDSSSCARPSAWHAFADRIATLVGEGRGPAAVVRAAINQGPLDDATALRCSPGGSIRGLLGAR